MAGRRKRMKSGSSSGPSQSNVFGGGASGVVKSVCTFGEVENRSDCRGHSPLFETCSFSSRCSIRTVYEVVSKFDSKKRELVRSIGFEGILFFPEIKQANRPFSLWLMSNVVVESSMLKIGSHISIRFNKYDVRYVLGIPYGGRSIVQCRGNSRSSKEYVMNKFLSEDIWEQRSMKSFQEIIERDYESPMSKRDEDNFKVAFVVFIVSNLLCPSSKHDYACIDYWSAIQDPDDIPSFDWSDFVIVRLLEAVRKLKQDAANGIKFPNMTGCVIFLQVLYLDSLSLDGFVMAHRCLPRVRQFSHDKLRAMIDADLNFSSHISGNDDTGVVTLRDALGCIYSWALDFECLSGESRSGRLLAIWETAVAMVHLLRIPLESAGPLFVAAADFQEQVNSGLSVNGTEALKFMSVLVSIMLPYTRGFRQQPGQPFDVSDPGYTQVGETISKGIKFMSQPIRSKDKKYSNTVLSCSSISPEPGGPSDGGRIDRVQVGNACQDRVSLDRAVIGDHVQNSLNSVMSGLDGLPHYLNVDLRVTTAMSQFYLLLRSMKPSTGLDLNSYVVGDQYQCASSSASRVLHGNFLPSPWDLGFAWPGTIDGIPDAKDQLGFIVELESPCFIHRSPKYIQVLGCELKSQMSGATDFGLDLFDALIRSVRYEDDELYRDYGNMRWRYYFESDVMEAILNGSFLDLDSTLSDHLSITRCTYDLSRCKLLFFPALIQASWVCFAWSLCTNVIYVFEPSYCGSVPERRLILLERACYRLKLAMQTLAGSVLEGWSLQCTSADTVLLTLPAPLFSPLNRTGALCACFCRSFDCSEVTLRTKMVCIERIYAKLLYDLIRFNEKAGSLGMS